jgi:hypothetical protein
MIGRELDQWTTSDWVDAKNSMNANSFKQLVRVANTGHIQIPSIVVPNFNPRITFISESDTATYQRVKDIEAVNTFNTGVKQWGEKVEALLKQSAQSRFGHEDRPISDEFPRLSDSIKLNLRFDKAFKLETRSVGFSVARHGVYLHEGAGRGYGGLTSSKWTDKFGKIHTTKESSKGRMGTGNRTAEYWFNDIIRNNMPELAEIVANYSLDIVVNMNSIFLPE